LVGHSVLAYPFGHVRGRVERWLVRAGYATALVFPLAVLLAYEGGRPLIQFTGPRDSVVDIVPSDDLAILVQKVEVVAFYGILGTCFIAVIVRNLAGPRRGCGASSHRSSSPRSLSPCALSGSPCSRSSTGRSPPS